MVTWPQPLQLLHFNLPIFSANPSTYFLSSSAFCYASSPPISSPKSTTIPAMSAFTDSIKNQASIALGLPKLFAILARAREITMRRSWLPWRCSSNFLPVGHFFYECPKPKQSRHVTLDAANNFSLASSVGEHLPMISS